MRALLASALFVVSCGGTAQPSATLPVRTAPPTAAATVVRTAAPTAAPTRTSSCVASSVATPATKATIELQKGGVVVMQLRPDKAPNTVANFARKARACAYDGLSFHRVIANFVAQGGDPRGDGSGGGRQPTELSDLPFITGAVGIARTAESVEVSNDSQFFICTGACRHLDGAYTNFGQVVTGQDVANAIRQGDRILTIRIE